MYRTPIRGITLGEGTCPQCGHVATPLYPFFTQRPGIGWCSLRCYMFAAGEHDQARKRNQPEPKEKNRYV